MYTARKPKIKSVAVKPYTTHKRTSEGKAQTLARRQVRALKTNNGKGWV